MTTEVGPTGRSRTASWPGESFEGCTLFLVPEGREPSKVSFLPHDPGNETEFVYWNVE